MRKLVLCASLLAFVDAAPPAVTGTLELAAARVPSTQTASATLTIHNGGAIAVSFVHDSVEVRVVSGERPSSAPRWGGVASAQLVSIDPGGVYRVPVMLPRCRAILTPCDLSAEVRFDVVSGGSTRTIVSDTVAYTFVPDPDATFDVPGLGDNRPLLLAVGNGTGMLEPDALMVDIWTGSQSDIPKVVGIFERHGLEVRTNGAVGIASFVVEHHTTETPEIAAAIREARAEVNAYPESEVLAFGTYPWDRESNLFASANDDARRSLDDLARILNAGDATPAAVAGDARIENDFTSWLTIESLGAFSYDGQTNRVGAPDPTASPAPLKVSTRVAAAAAGSGVASLPAVSVPLDATYRGPATSGLEGIGSHVAIAADRAQLYAIASVTQNSALGLGLNARAASLVAARERLDAFAELLGVRAGVTTLAALYPDLADDGEAIVTAGAAAAILDEPHASWRRVPSAVTRAPSPGVSPPPLVPIGTEGEPVVVARSLRERSFDPAVRLDVGVEEREDLLPAPEVLIRSLRADKDVTSFAVQRSPRNGDTSIGYELLLRSGGPARARVLEAIRAYYSGVRLELRTRSVPLIPNCAALERELERSAIRDAVNEAYLQAAAEGARLQKLVFGALYPFNTSGAVCAERAEPRALDRLQDQHGADTATFDPVTASLEVDLTFRVSSGTPR
jgi:hypothetical protein